LYEIDVAATLPFGWTLPTIVTVLPLDNEPHEPAVYVVAALVVTTCVPTVNVSAGHFPVRLTTVPLKLVPPGGTGPGLPPPLVVTVAVVVHDADWLAVSTAVQLTVVVPTGNCDPDTGVQVVVTGATPPVTVGLTYATLANLPLLATVVGIAGQLIARGATVGPVTTADEAQDAL